MRTCIFGLVVVDERIDNRRELIAQEDRYDSRRSFLSSEAMIVARRCDRHAQQLLVFINRFDDAGQKHKKSQVLDRVLARLEKVLAICGKRPVVVLA